MSSCLNINIRRIASSPRIEVQRCSPAIRVSVSPICSIGIDNSSFEVFMVKEGVFLLANGVTFRVKKTNGLRK